MARSPKTHRVKITNSKSVIDCATNQTILQAALAAGIDYPYACASGNCGTCMGRLEDGKVSMLPRGDAALSPKQAKARFTLACRARPRGPVTITWLGADRDA